MKRKWKDNRGETLVEVLAAVLIGALSVALLFTAVMASVNMDRSAQKTDEDFNTVLNDAENQSAPAATGVPDGAKVTVQGNGATATPSVNFYGGDGVWSYALPTTPP